MKVCSVCRRCYSQDVDTCRFDGCEDLFNAGDGDPEFTENYVLTRQVETHRGLESYQANETASGASCVVKIFSSHSNADLIHQEAKAVKSIFDPVVVGVYDVGTTEDGRVFVVSEDPTDQSLRDLITNVGSPDLLASIEIVRRTAEALGILHTDGITHGAIRPENIFLNGDGAGRSRVRLANIDYGRTIEQSITSNKFEIDSHIDELRYFAPELCAGGERSPRSDVYSLGIVFFELLTGKLPFDSSKASGLIEKHRTQRPPDVRINNFELRMLVTHALSETLQKHPASRQSSANLLARQSRKREQLATHKSTPPAAVKNTMGVDPSPAVPRVKIYETAPRVATRKVEMADDIIAPAPHVDAVEAPIATDHSFDQPASTRFPTATPRRSRFDALKSKLNEISSMVASKLERAAPPIEKAPRKIEWVQPDDDIPSLQDVEEILAASPLPDIAEISAGSLSDANSGSAESRENHAPAEAVALLRKEEISADESPISRELAPVLTAEPVATEVAPEIEVAVKQSTEPKPVPVRAAVIRSKKVRPKTEIIAPVATPEPIKAVEVQTTQVQARVETPPVVHAAAAPIGKAPSVPIVVTKPVSADADDEEITLVRRPKSKITIDLRKPRTIYKAPTTFARSVDEIDFQPTIIGKKSKKRKSPMDFQEGMFSAHFGSSSIRTDRKYRGMTIGVGCVVLAALFLFANDSVSKFFQNVSPGDSVTARATAPEISAAPAPKAKARVPSRTSDTKAATTETRRSKPSVEIKSPTKATVEKSKPTVTKTAITIKTAKSPERSTKATPRRTAPTGSTRPRIVRDPR